LQTAPQETLRPVEYRQPVGADSIRPHEPQILKKQEKAQCANQGKQKPYFAVFVGG